MAYLFISKILPLCLIFSLFLFMLSRASPAATLRLTGLLGRPFWTIISLGMIVFYAASLAFRLYHPAAIDFVEATVACESYLVLHGHPLYQGLQDVDRYSLMYGPLCYLPYSLFLALAGSSLGALLIALLFWNVALFVVLWLLFRKFLPGAESLVALAAIASALMMKTDYTFMIRGDVILVFCVALGLLACSLRHRYAAVCLFSLACACGIDVKVTAVFYFLVPIYLLARSQGRRSLTACLVLIPCLALVPFAMREISLRNYVLWLHEASLHPLNRNVLIMNILPAALVAFAPALMFWRLCLAEPAKSRLLLREHQGVIALFVLSILGTFITGGKIGAGRYHFNATFIISTYLAAKLWPKAKDAPISVNRRFVQLFAVYALFYVIPSYSEMLDMRALCVPSRAYAKAVNADIDKILRDHPGQTIEMGYGANPPATGPIDRITSFRTRLVLGQIPSPST